MQYRHGCSRVESRSGDRSSGSAVQKHSRKERPCDSRLNNASKTASSNASSSSATFLASCGRQHPGPAYLTVRRLHPARSSGRTEEHVPPAGGPGSARRKRTASPRPRSSFRVAVIGRVQPPPNRTAPPLRRAMSAGEPVDEIVDRLILPLVEKRRYQSGGRRSMRSWHCQRSAAPSDTRAVSSRSASGSPRSSSEFQPPASSLEVSCLQPSSTRPGRSPFRCMSCCSGTTRRTTGRRP